MVVVRGEEKNFTTLEESKPVLQFLPVHNRERPPKGTLYTLGARSMNSPKKNKSRSSRNYFPKLVHAVIWFFVSLLLLFATGVLANKRYHGLVMCSTIPHWLGLHLTHFPL
jgi:hypothetical protein